MIPPIGSQRVLCCAKRDRTVLSEFIVKRRVHSAEERDRDNSFRATLVFDMIDHSR